MELSEKARHILRTIRSKKRLSKLNSYDPNALFVQNHLNYVVAVKIFTMKYERARMGCLATHDTGKGEPVGHYYGTILYIKAEVLESRIFLEEGLVYVKKYDSQNLTLLLGQKANCLTVRASTFGWYLHNSIVCASSKMRVLSLVKIKIRQTLCL